MTSSDTDEDRTLAVVEGWAVTLVEDDSDGEDILLLARNGEDEDRYATARFDANGLAVSEFTDADGQLLPDPVRQPVYDATVRALSEHSTPR